MESIQVMTNWIILDNTFRSLTQSKHCRGGLISHRRAGTEVSKWVRQPKSRSNDTISRVECLKLGCLLVGSRMRGGEREDGADGRLKRTVRSQGLALVQFGAESRSSSD